MVLTPRFIFSGRNETGHKNRSPGAAHQRAGGLANPIARHAQSENRLRARGVKKATDAGGVVFRGAGSPVRIHRLKWLTFSLLPGERSVQTGKFNGSASAVIRFMNALFQ